MEALTQAERDFEQAAVYWKQKAEEYRLAGLADKERLDWLDKSDAQIIGDSEKRTVFMSHPIRFATRPTVRAAIDEVMRTC